MTGFAKHVRAPLAALLFTSLAALCGPVHAEIPTPPSEGVITVKSRHTLEESVRRIKADVAAKGIPFFQEIDQAKLAGDAGIKLKPSILLVFGNPPLGTLFIKANPVAGLDWPVRVLVFQDEQGQVFAAYNDFTYIARRHGIGGDELKHFATATGVIGSITGTLTN